MVLFFHQSFKSANALEYMREFDWLGDCTSCNNDCCHNWHKYIPENECIRPGTKYLIPKEGSQYNTDNITTGNNGVQKSQDTMSGTIHSMREFQDNRPLECRLFPFDVKEIEGKIMWVIWNNCHANPRLGYENFMNFFERKFSRELSLENIQQYVEHQKLHGAEKPSTKDHKEYIIIRELNWPTSDRILINPERSETK